MPSRLIATSISFAAFAVAVLVGLVASNPADVILWRAIICMVLCYFAGLAVGGVAQIAMRENIDRYKRDHPIETLTSYEPDFQEEVQAGPRTTSPESADRPAEARVARENLRSRDIADEPERTPERTPAGTADAA